MAVVIIKSAVFAYTPVKAKLMLVTSKQVNWLATVFFLIVIAIVFQQIATSMTEQGIASGSPYDNAASYPRAVAVIIGFLLLLQFVISFFTRRVGASPEDQQASPLVSLKKPASLLAIFGIYLGALGWLGYHLTTAPMIMAVMFLCGVRSLLAFITAGIGIAVVFAFLFEYFLKIVLPGGIFSLNIPW